MPTCLRHLPHSAAVASVTATIPPVLAAVVAVVIASAIVVAVAILVTAVGVAVAVTALLSSPDAAQRGAAANPRSGRSSFRYTPDDTPVILSDLGPS